MNDIQAPIYASLNITYAGQNGDLPDPLLFDIPDEQVRAIATEAVRAGGVRGIDARADADFTDFVIDRVAAHDGLPHRLIARPKTPFGGYVAGGAPRIGDGTNSLVEEEDPRFHPELNGQQEGMLELAASLMSSVPMNSRYDGALRDDADRAKMAVDLAVALKAEIKSRSF